MKKKYCFTVIIFVFLIYSQALICLDENKVTLEDFLGEGYLDQFTEIPCEPLPIHESNIWYHKHQKYQQERIHARNSEESGDLEETTLEPYILSNNWCGYIIEDNFEDPSPHSIDNVGGTWEVPALNPTDENTYCAIWVGIDGFNSPSVQQMGTSHNWVNGQQINFAWFQLFPSSGFYLPSFPVEIGDAIGVFIQHLNDDLFFLYIINYTKNVFAKVPERASHAPLAQRISAEWILERPTQDDSFLPLADFNTFPFFKCMATVKGVLTPIFNPLSHQNKFIFMKTNETVFSYPLGIDPSSFVVIHAPH